jgi:hypothetical protein
MFIYNPTYFGFTTISRENLPAILMISLEIDVKLKQVEINVL